MNVPQDNRYSILVQDVHKIAIECGRNPNDITLVAVSKTHSWDNVAPAYAAGCRNFGENRVQEALEKIAAAPADVRWHLIGSLQKNKVNKIIGKFALIHSVDSVDLATKIAHTSASTGVVTPILLEVNTSGEVSKHGFNEKELLDAFDALTQLQGIRLDGLMTMAPLTNDEDVIRRCFGRLRHLRDLFKEKGCRNAPMNHLSMGMSNDYRIAIEEGATLLRIGSALFET